MLSFLGETGGLRVEGSRPSDLCVFLKIWWVGFGKLGLGSVFSLLNDFFSLFGFGECLMFFFFLIFENSFGEICGHVTFGDGCICLEESPGEKSKEDRKAFRVGYQTPPYW